MTQPNHAFVRAPGPSFVHALGQRPGAPAIDLALAQAQHRLYADALVAAGLSVTELAPAADLPDACFVQDVVCFLPGLAILGRPAEPSRQGEVDAIRPILPPHLAVVAVEPPGTLEWGDVLRIDDTLYVGQSSRTNAAAVEQLRAAVAPLGLLVKPLAVPSGLHLLTGVSALGRSPAAPDGVPVLVAWEEYAGLPEFAGCDVILVPPAEAPAANCLAVGQTVIAPAGYPRTTAALWHRGYRVLTVPISEFAKADGGITCLSVLATLPG